MPKITALLHTHDDALRIARAVESLRACDEVLVVDHLSNDKTAKIAHEHGAKIKEAVPGVNPGVYAIDASHDWILCLLPSEAASESLEAALFEWKDQHKKDDANPSFAVALREETTEGWRDLGPQTRLVDRQRINWPGELPANTACPVLDGHILRFRTP